MKRRLRHPLVAGVIVALGACIALVVLMLGNPDESVVTSAPPISSMEALARLGVSKVPATRAPASAKRPDLTESADTDNHADDAILDGSGFVNSRAAQARFEPFATRGIPVFEEETPPDEQGRYVRARVVRTGMKYPLIRLVERWGPEGFRGRTASVADHLVVKLNDGESLDAIRPILERNGASVRRSLPLSKIHLVAFESLDSASFMRIRREIEASPAVKYAESDAIQTIR